MVKTKIILQPKKHFLDRFFNTDTSDFIFNHNRLYPTEIFTIGAIAETYRPHVIIKIPEVNYPLRTKTPDFFIDGKNYEVKSPIAIKGIKSLTRRAQKQLKSSADFLVIELANIADASVCSSLEYAYNYCHARNIINFIIMSHGDILYSTR